MLARTETILIEVYVGTFMLLSGHHKAGQNHNTRIRRANRPFGNVAWFKYFGTTVTTQNLIQEEIKMRLNSGDACYRTVFSSAV
jgi:hypothetical protein